MILVIHVQLLAMKIFIVALHVNQISILLMELLTVMPLLLRDTTSINPTGNTSNVLLTVIPVKMIQFV